MLRSIETSTTIGLRDLALIGVMIYCFLRIGPLLVLRVEDYERHGERAWLRLRKGDGIDRRVPVDHKAAAYLDAYIKKAKLDRDREGWLFRTVTYGGKVKKNPMTERGVMKVIKDSTKAAGIQGIFGCHALRVTGMKLYVENGGTMKKALAIAGLKSSAFKYEHKDWFSADAGQRAPGP